MSSPSPLTLAIPVFNAEEFLSATLGSLAAQGPHVRWWLQDGGSKDRTAEIARAAARPGDVVVSEKDAGQADAINRAMRQMGGEIIGFINGDDLLGEGTAERVVRYFAEHPEVDLIYGRVEWIDRDGRAQGNHAGHIASLAEVLNIYHVWWGHRQYVQPEVFFRRSLWEKAGPFDTRWHLAFDFDFWVRCFRAGARAVHVPWVISRFRLHAAQKSTAAERAADEIRAIVRGHLASGAKIGFFARLRLLAHISYDEYQLGQTAKPGRDRSSFSAALLRHPTWLLCPIVRARVQSSLAKLLGFHRSTAR